MHDPMPNDPELPGLPNPPETSAVAETTGASFAIVVSTDGRLVRIDPGSGGALVLQIERYKPLTLDRFQAATFQAAMAAIGGAG